MADFRFASLLLRRPVLFRGLLDSDCIRVLSRASHREYLFQDVLFWEGDPVKEVLLLTEGRVKITQFTKTGLEVVLRLNTPGEIVDVPSLKPGGIHCSTAQVLRACSVLAWDAATFAEAVEEFPILACNARSIVAQTLVELESRFCERATARAAPRLARAVVRLLHQVCHRVDGHMELDVSQEMLGQMTAMTAPTVCRLLGKWEERGLVNVRRGSLVVLDVPGLERLYQVGARLQQAGGLRQEA